MQFVHIYLIIISTIFLHFFPLKFFPLGSRSRRENECGSGSTALVIICMRRCGALVDDEGVILYRVLPCLVRMCKREESLENRILAAETLAYLIEVKSDKEHMPGE